MVKKKEPKFETAFKRLEEIVDELESGDLSLDKSLKIFEEGIRFSRFCTAKLDEAEKRIEMLENGELKPFSTAEARDEAAETQSINEVPEPEVSDEPKELPVIETEESGDAVEEVSQNEPEMEKEVVIENIENDIVEEETTSEPEDLELGGKLF